MVHFPLQLWRPIGGHPPGCPLPVSALAPNRWAPGQPKTSRHVSLPPTPTSTPSFLELSRVQRAQVGGTSTVGRSKARLRAREPSTHCTLQTTYAATTPKISKCSQTCVHQCHHQPVPTSRVTPVNRQLPKRRLPLSKMRPRTQVSKLVTDHFQR